jgi:protein KIBRA
MHPTLAKAHSLSSFDRLRSVTSIDLELDLQAYQARLSQLNDEITRLKEIKKKFEEAKLKGDSEPSWFTDNEQLQLFMAEADKAVSR